MNKGKVVYIGNNLTKKTKYNSTINTLSNKLIDESYELVVASDKLNIILRLIDMVLTVFKHRKDTKYILIDTFSTSSFYYAFVISKLAKSLKIKYIPILHGGNLPFRIRKSAKMANTIFNNSYKNIAPSNYLKIAFEKQGYEVEFIPNIIEIDAYNFKERKTLKPNLLYVRAFDKIYNPTMAIKVLNEIKNVFPNAKLCMVGPSKDESLSNCKSLAKELNLTNSIEYTGVLQKEEWHKKSEEYDLFINTTNFDNTPISVMEIMALGLPIISTNAGGLPYLISNNEDGILVDKNDYLAMSNVIIKFLKHPKRAYNLTLKAREKVESFDWKTVKHQWNNLLQ